MAGLRNIEGGDSRFFNNLFLGHDGLTGYEKAALPMRTGGNVFLKGARPCGREEDSVVEPGFDPGIRLVVDGENVELHMSLRKELSEGRSLALVTTEMLGRAKVPDLPFVRFDARTVNRRPLYGSGMEACFGPAPGVPRPLALRVR